MIVSKKPAMEQLERLLDYYDYEYKELPEELKKHADHVLRGIMKGRFEVTEKCTVKQYFKNPIGKDGAIKDIEYRQIKGSDKQEMDEYGANAYNMRAQALMGVICEKGLGLIEELGGADLSYMEALGILLLGL